MSNATRFAILLCTAAAMVAHVGPAAAQVPDLPMGIPEARYEHAVEKNVMVAMPDGVRLATDLYRPLGAGDRLPVILIRLPYNKDTYRGATGPAEFFAGQGYMVVVQDVRGQYASEGEYRVQIDDARDGYDTIEWIVQQPWSSGRVGTYGCSYLGEVQYLLSTKPHPAHVAMIPQSASGAVGSAGDFYTNFGVTADGGALTLSSIFGWFTLAGHKVRLAERTTLGSRPPDFSFPEMLRSLPIVTMARRADLPPSDFEDFVSHPPADPYWTEVGYLRDEHEFDTPSLHVNSWLDLTPEQTLYSFNLMRRNARSERARDNQFAIMSPTVHCASEGATENTVVGGREVGDARFPYWQFYLDWFDYWVKGVDNGVTERPKVHYYVMGLNEWRSADAWPVPGMTPTPMYLESGGGAQSRLGDGVLSMVKPIPERSDTFEYDPADPYPSRGGTICCTGNPDDVAGIFDQADLETRDDVLVYTSARLEDGLTIAGSVRAMLHVSSSARDTDFAVKLMDVDPEGRSWNVVNGILRVRYREGFDRTVWMENGEVYPIEVLLKATAHHFRPGHRIRVDISSSDFPMYDRNLNTGGDNYSETTWVVAENTVHHGGRYPSHVVLPVVR